MAGDREKYLSAGFNDYIAKPIIDETILLAIIERWMKYPEKPEDNENPDC